MPSEQPYKSILEHLNVAVVFVDTSLRLKHINPAAEVLLAVSQAKVIGTSLLHYFREDGSSTETLRKAIIEENQFTKRRAQWQLHNGEQLTVDYTVTPLSNQDGVIIEIVALDRLLRISREEALISSQETVRNLVRSMAHEIKNPLGGIRGAAQLLERELPNSDLEEFTTIIIEEVDRLRNLVDRMLGPRQLPQFAPTNAHEVLERIATVIKAECGSDIRIRRDYDPSIPEFEADKEMLIQALLNIARNAMQALQEADLNEQSIITLRTRIQRQFTIGQQHHPLVCRIDIEDNGPGIPQDMLTNIFYPMITGRPEGTGLGLAISQHLIQQHQGLVECDSQPGKTTFSIYIPLEQNHAA
ncbi:PAS domain-containing protein [Aestuariicella sp. G3-2]|uniref:nitrogen regulation protein NR(II) n=1 Tax=Pseudomaricurvus albidus TaxID=2842452 RepID=UPI001C0D48B9|nr:nitrogen regulation protein NR(II) [Aestuariicella albida]MBU3068380.1 PAS domain-containing protein [Aestuariicella albida]